MKWAPKNQYTQIPFIIRNWFLTISFEKQKPYTIGWKLTFIWSVQPPTALPSPGWPHIKKLQINSSSLEYFHCPATIVLQVGNDCMVDESVSIGEKVSIKKSVIGKHTTIGEKVKISNSVIMDHVTIMEGWVKSVFLQGWPLYQLCSWKIKT